MQGRLPVVLVGALCVCLIAAPLVASGETESSDDIARARARFAQAVQLLDEEQFAEALEAFEELHRARPHSVIVYNIAWCLSRLGRQEEALERFDAYLESDDASTSRRELAETERERLVEALQAEGTDETEESEESDETEAPPPEEPVSDDTVSTPGEEALAASSRRRRLRPGGFWAVFGLTLATGAAMTATGAVTLSMSNRWLEEGDINDRDNGRTLRLVTDVLLIATVVEAIVTLVLGLLTDFHGESDVQQDTNLP